MHDKNKLNEVLWKKAVGYTATESVDELTSDGGSLSLCKQKITTKEIPADMSAIKMLIEQAEDELDSLTDEELENEKIRLLRLLSQADTESKATHKAQSTPESKATQATAESTNKAQNT